MRNFLKTFIILLLLVANFYADADWVNTSAKVYIKTTASVVVDGNFTNNSSGVINNNGTVITTGNFSNNATFNSGNNSYVKLEGSSQNVGGTSGTVFSIVYVDGTNNKTLTNSISIDDTLVFKADNRVVIGNNNLFLINSGIIDTNTVNDKRYVVTNGSGFLVKNNVPLNQNFLFPVGDATNSYKPIIYKGDDDNFRVRVIPGVNPTTGVDQSCVQYTYITGASSAGNKSASLKLGWNNADEGTLFDHDRAFLWQYMNATGWELKTGTEGAHSNSTHYTDWYYKNTEGTIADMSQNTNDRFIVRSCMVIADAGIDTTICNSSPVDLTATGAGVGGNYEWNTGETAQTITVSPTTLTTYTVTVTDVYGCTDVDNIIVSVNSLPGLNIDSDDDSICAGNSVALTASGTDTYLWNTTETNNTISASPAVTTTYTVTGTDLATGCSNTEEEVIVVSANPTADAGSDKTNCSGYPLVLSVSGGSTYVWNTLETTSAITISPTITTTYVVTAFSVAGCQDVDSVAVSVLPLPPAVAENDTSICSGSSVTLTASGGDSYLWNTGITTNSITVTPVTTTTYIVTVTDAVTGCTDSDEAVVIINPIPNAPTVLPITACEYTDATLNVLNPINGYTYLWYGADTNFVGVGTSYTSNNITTPPPVIYVKAISDYGCISALVSTTIVMGTEPLANFIVKDSVTNILIDEEIELIDLSVNAATWSWDFDNDGIADDSYDQYPSYTYETEGIYGIMLVVTSADGCVDTIIKTNLIEVGKRGELFIPTAFSPNGDGVNDLFKVYGNGIKSMEIKVFNGWGFEVFSSTSKADTWDGTNKDGEEQPEGNYAYTFDCVLTNGDNIQKSGIITLVR